MNNDCLGLNFNQPYTVLGRIWLFTYSRYNRNLRAQQDNWQLTVDTSVKACSKILARPTVHVL